MTIIHASCVIVDNIGVLIRGPSGAGKSDLALRLIDEGAHLVADDYCDVAARNGALTAEVPPPIAGKLEVRGYGIVTIPYITQAVIGLVIDLKDNASIERMPKDPSCRLDGMKVARAWVDPTSPSAAARVRLLASTLKREAPQRTQQS